MSRHRNIKREDWDDGYGDDDYGDYYDEEDDYYDDEGYYDGGDGYYDDDVPIVHPKAKPVSPAPASAEYVGQS